MNSFESSRSTSYEMNKSTTIAIVIGTIVVIGGLAWMGRPIGNKADVSAISSNPTSSAASITTHMLESDATVFDFGTISMANGKVNHDFKVTNTSSKPATLHKIYTSCMCTAALFKFGQQTYGPFGMEGMGGNLYLTQTLNLGESGIVQAIYDPAAHGPAGVGAIDRFIYVEDKNGNQLKLEIKAEVTP